MQASRPATLSTRRVRVGLASGARDAGHTYTERESVVLSLELGEAVGLGEAAPLPGRSQHCAEECETALQSSLLAQLPEMTETLRRSCARGAVGGATIANLLEQATPKTLQVFPEARYAFQTALLDLWAKTSGLPARRLLAATSHQPNQHPFDGETHDEADRGQLPLACLLELSPIGTLLERARASHQSGYSTFKLKLGLLPFAQELAELRRLTTATEINVNLRFDVNQAWSRSEADQRLPLLSDLSPEFVEEPVPTEVWPELLGTKVPLAFDESLLSMPLAALCDRVRHLNLRALVLKPMLLGGIDTCHKLVKAAEKHGLEIVFSHVYDGPIAYASYIELALAWGRPGVAHGLAPHAGLKA